MRACRVAPMGFDPRGGPPATTRRPRKPCRAPRPAAIADERLGFVVPPLPRQSTRARRHATFFVGVSIANRRGHAVRTRPAGSRSAGDRHRRATSTSPMAIEWAAAAGAQPELDRAILATSWRTEARSLVEASPLIACSRPRAPSAEGVGHARSRRVSKNLGCADAIASSSGDGAAVKHDADPAQRRGPRGGGGAVRATSVLDGELEKRTVAGSCESGAIEDAWNRRSSAQARCLVVVRLARARARRRSRSARICSGGAAASSPQQRRGLGESQFGRLRALVTQVLRRDGGASDASRIRERPRCRRSATSASRQLGTGCEPLGRGRAGEAPLTRPKQRCRSAPELVLFERSEARGAEMLGGLARQMRLRGAAPRSPVSRRERTASRGDEPRTTIGSPGTGFDQRAARRPRGARRADASVRLRYASSRIRLCRNYQVRWRRGVVGLAGPDELATDEGAEPAR